MALKKDTTHDKTNITDHPQDDETINTSVKNVRKAIALLLTRKEPDEVIYIRSPEGLKLMHFRYEIDDTTVHKICLMFKRSPELKPYYAAIKSWCEENELQCKRKVFNKERYLEVSLRPYLDDITNTVFDAKQTIFKVKTISVGTHSTKLGFALQDLNHPYLFAFFGIGAGVSVALLPIYELFRLPYLRPPALNALDWPEIFLMSWFIIGILFIKRLNQKTSNGTPKKRKSSIFARTTLLLIAALTFFTR